MSVYTKDGLVLLAGGQVATSPDCCCDGACCDDGDCTITNQPDCESGGGTFQGIGTLCEDVDCGQATSGACCVGEVCSIKSPQDCEDAGGIYQGDDTTCTPDPCITPPPTGACCVGETCSIETAADCTALGGVYKGDGTTCTPNPCLVTTGACCNDGSCTEATEAECLASGGVYKGDGTLCDDVDCSLLVCDACYFNAFDFGPRRFKKKINTFDLHFVADPGGCGARETSIFWTQTQIALGSPSCHIDSSCTGAATCSCCGDTPPCNPPCECNENISGTTVCTPEFCIDCPDCGANISFWAAGPDCGSGFWDCGTPSCSPTYCTTLYTWLGIGTASLTLTSTLLDECIP